MGFFICFETWVYFKKKGGGKFNLHKFCERKMDRLSRKMSSILRHQAKEHGIPITTDGWVAVSDLCVNLGTTKSELDVIVQTNDKKRFEYNADQSRIRATQGHSMGISLNLEPLSVASVPEIVIHGTYRKHLDAILRDGLNRMSRDHIHMATGMPGESGVISGMRKSCEVILHIDAKQAIADGIVFYRSTNGVVLTAGINGVLPPKYIRCVEQRKAVKK